MAFSDDEVEDTVKLVTNYYFVDDEDEPITFSDLPIRWTESESSTSLKQYVFLKGTTDSGSETIYKKVIAWRPEFSSDHPAISVLYKGKSWIKLHKPRKSYEDTIRTILIAIHCLHYVKKHPHKSESSMWSHLQKVFSLHKVKPSGKDLLDHLPLIKDAVKHDRTIANSVMMLNILKDPKKRKVFDEDNHHESVIKKSKLMTDKSKELDEENEPTKGDEPDQVWDLCDDVCALCDNGGELLCCEGRCLRSFHAHVEAGHPSGCKSLGLSKDQIEATQSFLCMNCQYNQHQCFACGKLGSSDKVNHAEVFRCASKNCGHFYHPRCIAKLLHPINGTAAENIQKKISNGEPFLCVVHKCFICKKEENKDDKELQFAVCRRCPKVYHKKCLPREISFSSYLAEGIVQRAWNDLLEDRILIYCTKHEVSVTTLTPKRDHIIFPDVQENQRKGPPSQPSRGKLVTKELSPRFEYLPKRNSEGFVKRPSAVESQYPGKAHAKQASRDKSVSNKTPQQIHASNKHFKERVQSSSMKVDKPSTLDKNSNMKVDKPSTFDKHSSLKVDKPSTLDKHSSLKVDKPSTLDKHSSLKMDKPSTLDKHSNMKVDKPSTLDKHSSLKVDKPSTLDKHSNMKVDKPSTSNKPIASSKEESLNQKQNNGVTVVQGVPCSEFERVWRHVPATNKSNTFPTPVRKETESRKIDLLKEKSSLATTRTTGKSLEKASPHSISSNRTVDIAIPQKIVEGSHKAVEACIQNSEDHSFGDAKFSYETELVTTRTNRKGLEEASLQLSSSNNTVISTVPQEHVEDSPEPFQASEASSQELEDHIFEDDNAGCESEKFDNLSNLKIADKLHCYAQSGDTIVSFSCDSDDFSSMMSQKLEENGKRCSFENYNVFQSKGDFDFNNTNLPTGSRLIMSIKFPSKDEVPMEKFIDKILEFKPKLLLLICPSRTKLNENKWGYDLIWEETEPLVYLWSRCDWTSKHKAIAQNHDHVSNEEVEDSSEEEEEEDEAVEEAKEVILEELVVDPNLFASGPLPQFLYSNWSCGWLQE